MSVRRVSVRRVMTAAVAAIVLAAGLVLAQAPTVTAAPTSGPDAGVAFSSAVYGTGCSYTLTVPVNASGAVYFWEQKKGYPPIFIGKAQAYQLSASVRWIPRRIGLRRLYAVQDGKRSPLTIARVHQGYGSGGLCFAL